MGKSATHHYHLKAIIAYKLQANKVQQLLWMPYLGNKCVFSDAIY